VLHEQDLWVKDCAAFTLQDVHNLDWMTVLQHEMSVVLTTRHEQCVHSPVQNRLTVCSNVPNFDATFTQSYM